MDLSAISWNPFKKSEDDNEVKNKKSVEQTPEAIDIYGKNNDTIISNKDNVSVFSQQTLNDDADILLANLDLEGECKRKDNCRNRN